jgi:hypothetical protein
MQPANAQPAYWAQRLGHVRGFARHWSAIDPRTEVPPGRLLPFPNRRARPYLYTKEEILGLRLVPFSVPSVLLRWRSSEEQKQAGNAEKEKTMKLEEIKNKTNEAVSYLVAALESGQSDVLTQRGRHTQGHGRGFPAA